MFRAVFTSFLLAFLVLACTPSSVQTNSILQTITISPANKQIAVNTSQQFKALAFFSDNRTEDITQLVSWESSDSNLVTINEFGVATATAVGEVNITASFQGVSSNVGSLKVSNATLSSLELTPAINTMLLGTTTQYMVEGLFSDNTKQNLTAFVTWNISDNTIAEITQQGVLTPLKEGATNIQVSFNGTQSNVATLTVGAAQLVNLQITPANLSLQVGTTEQLTVLGFYSNNTSIDITNNVTLASGDESIVTLDNTGLLSAVSVGTVNITASYLGITNRVSVTVKNDVLTNISITPINDTIGIGIQNQYQAIGTFADNSIKDITQDVIWQASDTAIATISQQGMAQGVTTGKVNITASFTNVDGSIITDDVELTVSSLVSLQVSMPALTLAQQTQTNVMAYAIYADGKMGNVTNSVTWISTDTDIASVSPLGRISALQSGNADIRASLDGINSNNLVITVSSAQLTSIQLTPSQSTLPISLSQQISAIGVFDDGTAQNITDNVQWLLNNPGAVTVNADGKISAIAQGTSQLQAAFLSINSAPVTITVNNATPVSISLSRVVDTLSIGDSLQYQATARYSDNKTYDVTAFVNWHSSDPQIANISALGDKAGMAEAGAIGQTQLTASFANIHSSAATLVVSSASLTAIDISPQIHNVAANTSLAYKAIGIYDDNSHRDITHTVLWQTNNIDLASISPDGVLSAIATGQVTVTANKNSISSNSAIVNITNASLQRVEISPFTNSLAMNSNTQYRVRGIFDDGSRQDLTHNVTWFSVENDDISINSSTNASGILSPDFESKSLANPVISVSLGGRVTPLRIGTASVFAIVGSQRQKVDITVSDARLADIQVTPVKDMLPEGFQTQYLATGIYTDNSHRDITQLVTWQTSDTAIATISSDGQLLANGVGTVDVSAILDGLASQNAKLTVTDTNLTGIQITPASIELAELTQAKISATGIFADGSTRDISELVTWQSSNNTVAMVTDAYVLALSEGGASISASYQGVESNNAEVTVLPVTLSFIQISPVNHVQIVGNYTQYRALGTFSDNSVQDITYIVDWRSDDDSIASFGDAGMLHANSAGEIIVRVAWQDKQSFTNATVVDAQLQQISLSIDDPKLAIDSSKQITAIGRYSNNQSRDISHLVTWQSLSPSIAAVNQMGRVQGLSAGNAVITAGSGDIVSKIDVTVSDSPLVSIDIISEASELAVNTSEQLMAMGNYQDGSRQNLTHDVIWSSDNLNVATITESGYLSAVSVGGPVTINASLNGISNAVEISVTEKSVVNIDVSPANTTLAEGESQQFTATATFDDGSTQNINSDVTWFSSNLSVGSIDSQGLLISHDVGVTSIKANYAGVDSNTAIVNVAADEVIALIVRLPKDTLEKGLTEAAKAFTVTTNGALTDVTSQVIWSNSSPNVARISIDGEITAINTGQTNISATLGNLVSDPVTLEVTSAAVVEITISAEKNSIDKGLTLQYKAIASLSDGTEQDLTTSVTWYSADTDVATINSEGLLSSIKEGDTVISASLFGINSNQLALNVLPASLTQIDISPLDIRLRAENTQQYTATGHYSDGSSQNLTRVVTWVIDNTEIAQISSNGLLTAIAEGNTQISANLQGISSDIGSIQVDSIEIASIAISSEHTGELVVGATRKYTAIATYQDGTTSDISQLATWSSTNTDIAEFNSSNILTAIGEGTTSITASYRNIVSDSLTLTVFGNAIERIQITPVNSTIPVGAAQAYQAIGFFSNGTSMDISQEVNWVSSDSQIVSLELNIANALTVGKVTIQASLNGIESNIATLDVLALTLESISITPPRVNLGINEEQTFTAIGIYSDGSNHDISSLATFISSDSLVAQINDNNVLGIRSGQAIISATYQNVVSNNATVIVEDIVLRQIQVTPANESIAVGLVQSYQAIGIFSNDSTRDISQEVTWISTDTNIAVLDGSVAKGINVGETSIRATKADIVSNSATLTVSEEVISAVQIFAPRSQIAANTHLQFTATAEMSDGSTRDITNSVTWVSSDVQVASIVNGLLVSTRIGEVGITASINDIQSNAVNIEITDAELLELQISPNSSVIAINEIQEYEATGIFSDDTTQELTSMVNWLNSDPDVATIANGIVTGVTTGSAIISADYNGVASNLAQLTVSDSNLIEIIITPEELVIPANYKASFVATGVYSDGQRKDISHRVNWISDNLDVATIVEGDLSSISEGNANITANLYGITSNTANVSVNDSVLTAITLFVKNKNIGLGSTVKIYATGTFSDGATHNINELLSWESSNTESVIVNDGLINAINLGNSNITARYLDIVSEELAISVIDVVNIDVTPLEVDLNRLSTEKLFATANLFNGEAQDVTADATWISDDLSIATVNSHGVVQTGGIAGSTTITASFMGHASEALINVGDMKGWFDHLSGFSPDLLSEVELSNLATTTIKGLEKFVCRFSYVNHGENVNFQGFVTQQSSNEYICSGGDDIVYENEQGERQPLVSGVNEFQWLSHTPPLGIVGGSSILSGNQSYTLCGISSDGFYGLGFSRDENSCEQADNIYFKNGDAWSFSGNEKINYYRYGNNVGHGEDASVLPLDLESITIMGNNNITLGTTEKFKAIGQYSDGSSHDISSNVKWTSSDLSILAVDADANVTAVSEGFASLQARLGGISVNFEIQVIAVELVKLEITSPLSVISKGKTLQFQAMASFSDGTSEDVTLDSDWRVSQSSIASIDTKGLLTSLNVGTTDVYAEYQGLKSNIISVQVSSALLEAIRISSTSTSLPKNETLNFIATGLYSDGQEIDITEFVEWQSSDTNVAAINTKGVATGVAGGTTNISAVLEELTSNSITLSVINVTSIAISTTQTELVNGFTLQYKATATFNDGSTADLTSEVQWQTSDQNIASINKDGLLTSLATGSVNVSATFDGVTSNNLELTIIDATLMSIAVKPETISLNLGETESLIATGTYSDGVKQDISSSVTWLTSNNNVSVSESGVVTTLAEGKTNITASFESIGSNIVSVTVLPAKLVEIRVGDSATIPTDIKYHRQAIGRYSDGRFKDITLLATWTSSNNRIASFERAGQLVGHNEGNVTISATYEDITNSYKPAISVKENLVFESLLLSEPRLGKKSSVLALGERLPVRVAGFYGQEYIDLTSYVTYRSDNPAVSVADGIVTATSVGKAMITATYQGQIVSNELFVTVTDSSLESVTVYHLAGNDNLTPQSYRQLYVQGLYENGLEGDVTYQAVWSSNDEAVATISENGVVNAVKLGNSELTATVAGLTDSQNMAVVAKGSYACSKAVTEYIGEQFVSFYCPQIKESSATADDYYTTPVSSESLYVGDVGMEYGIFTYENAAANCSVQNYRLPTLSEVSHLSKYRGDNNLSINYGFPNYSKRSAWLKTNEPDQIVNLRNFSVKQQSHYAQNLYLAYCADTVSITRIDIQSRDKSIAIGDYKKYTATATFSDGSVKDISEYVEWQSSDDSVATVSLDGTVQVIGSGRVTLSASLGGIKTDVEVITDGVAGWFKHPSSSFSLDDLTQAERNNLATGKVYGVPMYICRFEYDNRGETKVFQGYAFLDDQNQYFCSANMDTYYVDESGKRLSPMSSANEFEWLSLTPPATASVGDTISSGNANDDALCVLEEYGFSGLGFMNAESNCLQEDNIIYSNGNSWFFSSLGHALVYGNDIGEGDEAELTFPEFSGIAITAVETLQQGEEKQLVAIGSYTNTKSRDVAEVVKWRSNNENVAVVDPATGLLSAVGEGVATISSQMNGVNGAKNTQDVIVGTILMSIDIFPAKVDLALGRSQQYTAIGSYSDRSTADISNLVTWELEPSGIATIDNNGLLSTIAEGSTDLSATLDGVTSNTALINVVRKELIAIDVSFIDPNISIAVGELRQFVATGIYSDGSRDDLTQVVTWSSSDQNKARIDSKGVLTAINVGDTNISATFNGIQSDALLISITDARLMIIDISPSSTSIILGGNQQYTATGSYSDRSTADITNQVTWTLDPSNIASIDGNGLLTSLSEGTGSLTASLDDVTSDPAIIVITEKELISISVSPETLSIANGSSEQLIATGNYSDGSSLDISSQVTWLASQSNIIIDDNGLLTAQSIGNSLVTASLTGIGSNVVTVTVTEAVLVSIGIGEQRIIPRNIDRQLTAVGRYSDGRIADVTQLATWESSDNRIASFSAPGLITGHTSGVVTNTATYQGISNNYKPKLIVRDSVTYDQLLIEHSLLGQDVFVLRVGDTLDLQAIGFYNQQSINLNEQVTWRSDNPAVNINDGEISADQVGIAKITTTYKGLTSNELEIIVTNAAIEKLSIYHRAGNDNLTPNSFRQLYARADYANGLNGDVTTKVTWISDDPQVSISPNGVVKALEVGSATLTATTDGLTTPYKMTVVTPGSYACSTNAVEYINNEFVSFSCPQTIEDNPSAPNSYTTPISEENYYIGDVGMTYGIYDYTGAVANCAAQGYRLPTVEEVTHLSRYRDGNDLSTNHGFPTYGPNEWLKTNDQQSIVSIRDYLQLNWIDFKNNSYLAYCANTLTVVSIDIRTDNTRAGGEISIGDYKKYTAIATFSDGTKQDISMVVDWQSSNKKVGVFLQNGTMEVVGSGDTKISAGIDGVESDPIEVITKGFEGWFAHPSSSFSLDDLSAAERKNLATAKMYGAPMYICRFTYDNHGDTKVFQGYVLKQNEHQYICTGGFDVLYRDAAGSVRELRSDVNNFDWLSLTPPDGFAAGDIISSGNDADDPLCAVEELGYYGLGFQTGGAQCRQENNIIGSDANPWLFSNAGHTFVYGNDIGKGDEAQLILPLLTGIVIAPIETVQAGETQQLVATAQYQDGLSRNVSDAIKWISRDTGIASINERTGLLTGQSDGVTTIVAEMFGLNGKHADEDVIVGVILTSIVISPSTADIPLGESLQLSVTGNYSDGSSADITTSVNWTINPSDIAGIDNAGLLTSLAQGNASIVASFDGVDSDPINITVTEKVLEDITVTITDPGRAIAAGESRQLIATGTYSDGSTADLSSLVRWDSSDFDTATIDDNGLLTAIAVGDTNVTAADQNITSDPVLISIVNPKLTAISISPLSVNLPQGQTQQFVATGRYSDSSQVDITNQVTWISNSNRVSIDSSGLGTAHSLGEALITASMDGIDSDVASVIVTQAELSSIHIVNDSTTIPEDVTLDLQAIGRFSDGRVQNITSLATWSSSDDNVASFLRAGALVGHSNGRVTLQVAYKGLTNSYKPTITVNNNLVLKDLSLKESVLGKALSVFKVGQSISLEVMGYSSNQSFNVTDNVTWTSSNPDIQVNNGKVTASFKGRATISASFNNQLTSNTITVMATDADLEKIAVYHKAGNNELTPESYRQLYVLGTYANGLEGDVTTHAQWTSDDENIATISNSGIVNANSQGNASLTANVQGLEASQVMTVIKAGSYACSKNVTQYIGNEFVSFYCPQIKTDNPSAPNYYTTPVSDETFYAGDVGMEYGIFDFTQAVANCASQNYRMPIVGEVSHLVKYRGGNDLSINHGMPTLSKRNGWLKTASSQKIINIRSYQELNSPGFANIPYFAYCADTVALDAIDIVVDDKSVKLGNYKQYKAIARFSDGNSEDITSYVDWVSTDDSVAMIDEFGVLKGINSGSADITASLNGVSSSPSSVTISGVSGWFEHPSPSFLLSDLTAEERNNLATAQVYGVPMFVCRTRYDNQGNKRYFQGVVTENAGQYYCSGGDNIFYTDKAGTKAKITSSAGDFDWLSLTPPTATEADKEIPSGNAGSLCQTNGATGHYGLGYIAGEFCTTDANLSHTATPALSSVLLNSQSHFNKMLNDGNYLTSQLNKYELVTIRPSDANWRRAVVLPDASRVMDGRIIHARRLSTYGFNIVNGGHTDAIPRNASRYYIAANGKWVNANAKILNRTAMYTWKGLAQTYVYGNGIGHGNAAQLTLPKVASIVISSPEPYLLPDESQSYTARATYQDGSSRDVSDFVRWYSSEPQYARPTNFGPEFMGYDEGTTNIQAKMWGVTAVQSNILSLFVGEVIPFSGWFAFPSETFTLSDLTEEERKNLATANVKGIKRYICRFTYDNHGVEKLMAGYVIDAGDGTYKCTTGEDISYRDLSSKDHTLISEKNDFEWLSLTAPIGSSDGDPIPYGNGHSLCVVDSKDFYGLGYKDQSYQCRQENNIYWKNGNLWRFSSRGSILNYGSAGQGDLVTTLAGWFAHPSVKFDPANLFLMERQQLATARMYGRPMYICRFSYDNRGDETLFQGYAVKQADESFICTGGPDLLYDNGNDRVELKSQTNDFEWLSLVPPPGSDVGDNIPSGNGANAPLCYVEQLGYYGIGFTSSTLKCSQAKNIYHSNGNLWGFDSLGINPQYNNMAGQGNSAVVKLSSLSKIELVGLKNIATGDVIQLLANATYLDGSTQDVTPYVKWTSSDANIATVGEKTGSVTGVDAGSVNIKAEMFGVEGMSQTGNIIVDVGRSLIAIDVVQLADTHDITPKSFRNVYAQAQYSDGSSQDVSKTVTWQTSDSKLAKLSGNKVQGVAPGSVTISASLGATSGSMDMTITQPGSYPCATPFIIHKGRAFYCPEIQSQRPNATEYYKITWYGYGQIGQIIALYKPSLAANYCRNRIIAGRLPSLSELSSFLNSHSASSLRDDYGWAIGGSHYNWAYTGTHPQGNTSAYVLLDIISRKTADITLTGSTPYLTYCVSDSVK